MSIPGSLRLSSRLKFPVLRRNVNLITRCAHFPMGPKQLSSSSPHITSLINCGKTAGGSFVVAAHSVQRRDSEVSSRGEPRLQHPRRIEPGLKVIMRFCLRSFSISGSRRAVSYCMSFKPLALISMSSGLFRGWSCLAFRKCEGRRGKGCSSRERSWNLHTSSCLIAI